MEANSAIENEIQDDILKELNEEIKIIDSIKIENGIIDIDTYRDIRDIIHKYADIKQFRDKQDHRKRRREKLANKDMKEYKSEVIKFMDVELKSHLHILNYICDSLSITPEVYSKTKCLHDKVISSDSGSKITSYTLPKPKISKELALKTLKFIEEERIKANEEGSLKVQGMMTPKENEENQYRVGLDDMMDRVVIDCIIQDDAFKKYGVEEEHAIEVLEGEEM